MTQESFGLVGLSYKAASVSVREQLSLSSCALTSLRQDACDTLSGFAVLSTCNRVEFYAHGEAQQQTVVETLRTLLSRTVSLERFKPYLYEKTGEDTARHLARVAAGLDSMVLGESQILGQVGRCLQVSKAHGLASPLLTGVFQTALRAGKRVRQETALGRKPVSIASVAVNCIRRKVGPLHSQHIVILGLGEIGILVVKILQKEKVGQLTFVNRSAERAEALAENTCAQAVPMAELRAAIEQADIVVSATNAPHLVIEPEHIQSRGDRALLLIDLAVPRDIDIHVAALPNVVVMNVDDLRAGVEASFTQRRAQVPYAHAIIEEELDKLKRDLKAMAIEPVIVGLRRKAESIRQGELARALHELGPLSPEDTRQLEYFSHSLVNKLLHEPTRQLRHNMAMNGEAERASGFVRKLFALTELEADE